jgi:hypothetical protein
MNSKEAREFLEYAIEHPNPNGNLTDEHTQTAIQVITIALKALGVCDRIKAIIDGWAVDDDEYELLDQIANIMILQDWMEGGDR